jgi:hypothetical protein
VKQIILKYKCYSWSKGTQYTAICPDGGAIEVCSPILLPATWSFEGSQFKLKCGSNTSSTLFSNQLGKIGEIHESIYHWNVLYKSSLHKLIQLKRGFFLKSSSGLLATIKTNSIGRIICTYNESKQTPLELLLYVTIYYRLSLDSGGG